MSFPCPLFVVFIPQKAEKPPTREGGFSYPFIIYFYGVNAIPGAEWVSVKFSSVIHLTVDDYYLRGFGFISISV